jgi:class 3 adenylate cyclase
LTLTGPRRCFRAAELSAKCELEIRCRGDACDWVRSLSRGNLLPQDQRIEFRIGIHIGDIIIDDNDEL